MGLVERYQFCLKEKNVTMQDRLGDEVHYVPTQLCPMRLVSDTLSNKLTIKRKYKMMWRDWSGLLSVVKKKRWNTQRRSGKRQTGWKLEPAFHFIDFEDRAAALDSESDSTLNKDMTISHNNQNYLESLLILQTPVFWTLLFQHCPLHSWRAHQSPRGRE